MEIYNHKVVQSSMGSALVEELAALQAAGAQVLLADMNVQQWPTPEHPRTWSFALTFHEHFCDWMPGVG